MGRKLGIADLSDPKTQAKFSDEQAFKAMKSGLTDASGAGLSKAEAEEQKLLFFIPVRRWRNSTA